MGSWLTVDEAAGRVGRSEQTIRRWIRDKKLRSFNGKLMEAHVLDVDRAMRANVGGRPREEGKVPLVVNGREVGYVTIGADGEISGRMHDTPKP